MIGTTLGRYRIVELLGWGGMGSVWRAEDPILKRSVAIKVLAPELAGHESLGRRLLREAQVASVLRHPNLAAAIDAGEHESSVWIAYDFVDGESLLQRSSRGPLEVPQILTIARETAAALAYLHARGVLHRDVTSGNVMVTREGHAVLIDFGLARSENVSLNASLLTNPGTLLGTPAYLAPEILKDQPATERSDLYSFGVVLYLMLTGSFPHRAGSAEAMVYKVLNEPVVPPSELRPEVPPAVERIVLKLLAREPADRYANAGEAEGALMEALGAAGPTASERRQRALARRWRALREAARRVGRARVGLGALAAIALVAAAFWLATSRGWLSGTARAPRVLAVLPMRNTSSDVEGTAHFGEALGSELARRLGSSRGFRVLPWETTVRYGDSKHSPVELAKTLRADELLTGSYRTEGGQLEVHAVLVDGRSGLLDWSEPFTRSESDVISLQSDLAEAVSRRLDPSFGREARERLVATAPGNPEAYRYFILASSYWRSDDPATMPLVQPFFEKAIELDPALAEAWVGLGAVLVDRYYRGEGAGSRELASADSMFRRALALHPHLPAAERGIIRVAYEQGGNDYFRILPDIAAHALERDAHDVDELQTAIWGFTLAGLPELALPPINRALALDPNNQGVRFYLVMALAWGSQPQRCFAAGTDYVRRFGEDLEVYWYMSGVALALGRDREAATLAQRAVELNRDAPSHPSVGDLAQLYLTIGDTMSFRAYAAQRIPDLEAQARAQPDNARLSSQLDFFYELAGDEADLRRVRSASVAGTSSQLDWSTLARLGHVEAALAALRTSNTSANLTYPMTLDSIGLPRRRTAAGIEAVLASPAYRDYRAACDRFSLPVFKRYREIVARYFPDDPDLPKPRTEWPRSPSTAPAGLRRRQQVIGKRGARGHRRRAHT